MKSWLTDVVGSIGLENALALARALLLAGSGWIVARLVRSGVTRLTEERMERHQRQLLRRAAYSSILILFGVAALHQMGFNLGVLLGAAGVASVAIGFASQTSASNFISGLFLIAERPFAVGDVISVGPTQGEVLSIDLLSVKLRTFDNLFVRIPNETLLKTELRTLTRFPLRRADLAVGVAYGCDLEVAQRVMLEVADRNPLALEEPRPLIILLGFGDSAINFQLSVWGRTESYLELKTGIQVELWRAFARAGIEIPFPQRTLTVAGDALPIRLVGPPEPGAGNGEER